MSEQTPQQPPRPPRRPRLRLPFDNRKPDAGTWAYDHRIGLSVTLIVYLVLMIAFVSSRIVIGRKPAELGMEIDLRTLAELEAERNRLQEEVDRKQQEDPIDWRSVRNIASNENTLNEQLKDDRGTNAAALNNAASDAQDRIRANREAYERGLADVDAIGERPTGDDDGRERQDVKVKGTVTVSFSFTDPVRTSRHIEIPAYLCEGSGEVVVAATLDRAGKVVGARVTSGGDECMRDAALRAARLSTFNIDQNAPAKHNGTITYLFIPQ